MTECCVLGAESRHDTVTAGQADAGSPFSPISDRRDATGGGQGLLPGGPMGRIDRAELQTELAADRTLLAVERTYDAWIRTGLTALASGIGARALLGAVVPAWLAKSCGAMLLLFAALCFLVGAWREISTDARLPEQHIRGLPPALLIMVNGFLVAVALAALVGVVAVP